MPIGDAKRFHPLLQDLTGGGRLARHFDRAHARTVHGEERAEKNGDEPGGHHYFNQRRTLAKNMRPRSEEHARLTSRQYAGAYNFWRPTQTADC